MHLKRLELNGFKSFAHKSEFVFDVPIIAIVGPNGSGKSNIVEAIRFVLGEQSVKSMRGKTGSDLIFKGSKDISKMSRASVSISFDNTDRVFSIGQTDNTSINVDFDEVTISRQVFVDGASVYKINGTEVRMKDIHELIASINIGASGHHIISQGEADRYLNANSKDRRTLIEEALGLKVYQYRLKESGRKLDRALDNLKESELLRREIAPHLKFLKRQVDKIQKAKHLRIELQSSYQDYFQKEDFLIEEMRQKIDGNASILKEQKIEVQQFLSSHQEVEQQELKEESKIRDKQQELTKLQLERQDISREAGRIEGMISVIKQPKQTEQKKNYSRQQVTEFAEDILLEINRVNISDTGSVSSFFEKLRSDIGTLLNTHASDPQEVHDDTLSKLEKEQSNVQKRLSGISSTETEIQKAIDDIGVIILQKRKEEQENQRTYYEFLARKKELDAKQSLVDDRKSSLAHRVEDRDQEYQEARVLLGVEVIDIQSQMIESFQGVSAETQFLSRRELERIKIRLEDMGGGSGIETIKEYQDTLERDEFLEKEILDVNASIESLNGIISDLKDTLNVEFDAGVKKINTQFDRFFKLMFGGGQAVLKEAIIIKRRNKKSDEEQPELFQEEEQAKEYGIDIAVQLPRKKVSDLEMLSGGERSLTSIALLFALSQVNPPPFLVLDETDAALDEANSQKYGDMIESLSEYSQLILVTHNRETMSRAQTLFGITLGRDDASTMLSLRLEDAEQYAK